MAIVRTSSCTAKYSEISGAPCFLWNPPATQKEATPDDYRPDPLDCMEISAVSEAEWTGFSLGCNGFAVVGPAHYSKEELDAFNRGHAAGFKAYEESEQEEWLADLTDANHHEDEIVRALGVLNLRSIGGAA